MQQSGERVKLHALKHRKQWSDRWSIIATTAVVLVWLLASWSASAAELLPSGSDRFIVDASGATHQWARR